MVAVDMLKFHLIALSALCTRCWSISRFTKIFFKFCFVLCHVKALSCQLFDLSLQQVGAFVNVPKLFRYVLDFGLDDETESITVLLG